MALQAATLCPGYFVRPGTGADKHWLIRFMQQTYQEDNAEGDFAHLHWTVEQYLSPETPFWLVGTVASIENGSETVACLWLGNAIDQLRGDRYAHILLLYVAAAHRRRGIGSALMLKAESWARQRGDRQIGLQVFSHNHNGLDLYTHLGYQTQILTMVKPISE